MLPAHALVAVALLVGTDPARAHPRDAREEAARLLGIAVSGEPDVEAVQRAAEARASPSAGDAESWRRRARIAGMLPRLVAEYRRDDRTVQASGISSGEPIDYIRAMPGDTVLVRLDWSLDGLVFGRSELRAAAAAEAAASRRTAAAERATKLYYDRLRLRLALLARPPADGAARADAEIELASVTAQLHALTGLYGEALR